MKRSGHFLLVGAMLLATTGAFAGQLTPDQALQRAVGSGPLRVASDASRYELSYISSDKGFNAAYVFTKSKEKGFIVVSAEDCVPALLGYADTQFADENGNPAPGFEYWLDLASRHICATALGRGPRHAVAPRAAREPIAPLCSTLWGQDWPYSNLCPMKGGKRCVTGCAATSTAQVLKYHNWPPVGMGSNSYNWNGRVLSVDFAETPFDWNNMLDDYRFHSDVSETQATAVATLMQAVGYGMNMDYSPEGSGANIMGMIQVVNNNLRYSKAAKYLAREWLSLPDWEDEIYASLAADCPVIYNGQSVKGGHSFVCDGYEGDGYFHINWGWEGLSDGFFLLDALDPMAQGTGGTDAPFTYGQQIMVGLAPDRGQEVEPYYQLEIYGALELEYQADNDVVMMKNFVINPGIYTIPSGVFGLVFTPVTEAGVATGEPEYVGYIFGTGDETDEDDGPLEPYYGFAEVDFDVSELPVGRYQVKPFFCGPDDVIQDLKCDLRQTREYIMLVREKKKVLRAITPVIPEITDVNFAATFSAEVPIRAEGTMLNTSNKASSVALKAAVMSQDLQTTYLITNQKSYSLMPDANEDFEFAVTIADSSSLVVGETYMVALGANDGANGMLLLTDPVPMKFTDESGVADALADPELLPHVYYNLQGVKVAETPDGSMSPALNQGVYIVKTPISSKKIVR